MNATPTRGGVRLRRRGLARRRVRRAEQEQLAAELVESVVHLLSLATLQLMSQSAGRNVDELRQILAKVAASVEVALAELRTLVGLRRGGPTHDGRWSDHAAYLRTPVEPRTAADQWGRRLCDAGLRAKVSIPEAVDLLPSSIRHTLARGLDVGCGELLRDLGPGSPCVVEIDLTAGSVELRIGHPAGAVTAGTPPARSLGLRALSERVDLMRGTLRARASTAGADFAWVLELSLPYGPGAID